MSLIFILWSQSSRKAEGSMDQSAFILNMADSSCLAAEGSPVGPGGIQRSTVQMNRTSRQPK